MTTPDVAARPKIEREFHRRKKSWWGANQIGVLVMSAGIGAMAMINNQWLRFSIACVGGLIFFIPFILRAFWNHNEISTEKVCGILRKKGLTPIISNDGICWTCNGKDCMLRIRSICQVEITREYDIPSVPDAIEGNEKAAIETTKEVYLAKVAVREDNGCNKLAFSTESLCVSAKELATYIPMCMEILDFAEDRYQEHITEIYNGKEANSPRKIGFIY